MTKTTVLTKKTPENVKENQTSLNGSLKGSQVSRTSVDKKGSTIAFQQEIELRRKERQAKLDAAKVRKSAEKQAALAKAEIERQRILEEEKRIQKEMQEAKARERLKKEAIRLKKEEEDKKLLEAEERADLHRKLALIEKAFRSLRLISLSNEISMKKAEDWNRYKTLSKTLYFIVLELRERWKGKKIIILEKEEQAELGFIRSRKR